MRERNNVKAGIIAILKESNTNRGVSRLRQALAVGLQYPSLLGHSSSFDALHALHAVLLRAGHSGVVAHEGLNFRP